VQTGTQNKNKVIWASVLGGVALLLIAYEMFSGPSAPVTAAQPTTTVVGKGKKSFGRSGRNIFVAQVDIPKPVASGIKEDLAPIGPPAPPPPPPPPPINLKFFGFANKPGEPKKVFLSQGDDVFIAVEGDIVDRRYKVLHIGPASVEIEDVLYNNRQNIPLTQAPG
jgi:hypothetical protein